jgi:hypothetical protein
MKKAFFLNGGSGRVFCAIPALEHYVKNVDPTAIIVAEAWMELFLTSPSLANNVYPMNHKNIFEDKLLDREIISPEPYRLNAYFNQKVNLIQAFDMLINETTDEIPKSKEFNLNIGKGDQVFGYNFTNEIKTNLKKQKVVVFQPFGSGAKMQGNFIIDETGRSFELSDVMKIIEELGKHYAVILMTDLKIPPPPGNKQLSVALPENINLLQWMAIIKASDYFLGCDSVGQHFANALKKPATVVIGATFPENISYPNNKDFTIIDGGKGKRTYSPIRISMDYFIERSNEELMVLSEDSFKRIIKSITDKLGKSTQKNSTYSPTIPETTNSCCPPVQVSNDLPFSKSIIANSLESKKV